MRKAINLKTFLVQPFSEKHVAQLTLLTLKNLKLLSIKALKSLIKKVVLFRHQIFNTSRQIKVHLLRIKYKEILRELGVSWIKFRITYCKRSIFHAGLACESNPDITVKLLLVSNNNLGRIQRKFNMITWRPAIQIRNLKIQTQLDSIFQNDFQPIHLTLLTKNLEILRCFNIGKDKFWGCKEKCQPFWTKESRIDINRCSQGLLLTNSLAIYSQIKYNWRNKQIKMEKTSPNFTKCKPKSPETLHPTKT